MTAMHVVPFDSAAMMRARLPGPTLTIGRSDKFHDAWLGCHATSTKTLIARRLSIAR